MVLRRIDRLTIGTRVRVRDEMWWVHNLSQTDGDLLLRLGKVGDGSEALVLSVCVDDLIEIVL